MELSVRQQVVLMCFVPRENKRVSKVERRWRYVVGVCDLAFTNIPQVASPAVAPIADNPGNLSDS